MSIDLYNKLTSRYELYRLLEQSEDDFSKGHTLSFEESMKLLREALNDGTL
jgi:prevent-host-death family protein